MSQLDLSTPAEAPSWRRAEIVLLGVAVVSLVTLLISVRTVWGGLPAHPLFIHVPVIMVPLAVIGALALSVRPAWFERWGVLVCLCSIIAMSSIFLAENAGGQLQNALHLRGEALRLITEHSSAANKLAILVAALTVALLGDFSAHRVGAGQIFGTGAVDRFFAAPATQLAFRVVVVVLALASAYYVYRVGDLGARAVWQGRLQAAQGIPPS